MESNHSCAISPFLATLQDAAEYEKKILNATDKQRDTLVHFAFTGRQTPVQRHEYASGFWLQ